jgi:ketosteroid isomerase-like protein
VRLGFDAFARGDIDAVLDLLHDEAEWSPGIGPVLGVETLRGKEAIRRFFVHDLFDGFDEFRAEALSVEAVGDHALVASRYTGRGERSGLEVDQTFWAVYWIRDGKLVAFRDFESRAAALAALEAPAPGAGA